ncbi:MAG: LysM peptidoglycan-binding domain-containing protein [Anaerolineales bacterium]|nr:LysM peptidoglycan-binding domain-containing protein [Anaerolineales bacterium]
MKKPLHIFLSLLAVWLVISLACNLPEQTLPELSAEQLRQTLKAVVHATQQAQTPVFGQTASPQGTQIPQQSTGTPVEPAAVLATPAGLSTPGALVTGTPGMFLYAAQPGDTLPALAGRFGVNAEQIVSAVPLSQGGFLAPGHLLHIPDLLGDISYPLALLPDSETIASPSTVGFDIEAFVSQAGGYLSGYRDNVKGESLSGAQVVQRVALESSVNPRFLLAVIEFRSHWVLGQPANPRSVDFPIGFSVPGQTGLYRELVMVATHFEGGYYGWRSGALTEMKFRDGSLARLSPQLNAGSIGLQVLFSKLYRQEQWQEALYGESSFSELYVEMFGDPWVRAATVEPLFPLGLGQPTMELPFAPGQRWSLTGGPHPSWRTNSPRGALDFAPVTGEPACSVSKVWALAAAPGLVTRSERNVVTIDLDGDGYEQTGWVILYFHIADQERIAAGTWVNTDDQLGHPSCEGGASTGTHLHIARKYNGEWIAADGPLPFVLSGWQCYAGEKNYQGELRKGDQVAVASPVGPRTSIVVR